MRDLIEQLVELFGMGGAHIRGVAAGNRATTKTFAKRKAGINTTAYPHSAGSAKQGAQHLAARSRLAQMKRPGLVKRMQGLAGQH